MEAEEGLNVHAFVSKVSGNGGYVLVEAGNPKVVAPFVTKFNHWNDVHVVPVIDVGEAVPIAQSTLAWRRVPRKADLSCP